MAKEKKERVALEETPERQPEKKKSDKPRGWHSRRHETPEAHYAATARYQAEHGPETRRAKAEARATKAAERTLREQLNRLTNGSAKALAPKKSANA